MSVLSMALLVITRGYQSCAMYLAPDTCLNHAHQIAEMIGASGMKLSLFHGHDADKWQYTTTGKEDAPLPGASGFVDDEDEV